MKKLYRSRTNRIFTGLLGGIGEYFNIDPVLVRLLFMGLLILTGIIPGIIFYIVGLFIVPEHPEFEIIRDTEASSS